MAASTPARPRPKVLTLTSAAADRVREVMTGKPEALALKIGIKKGGCAGMEYSISWADSIGKFDEVIEDQGVKVVIEPAAVLYLIGTEMDWKVDRFASQFVFNNPNQKSACGCGESVNLTPADKGEIEHQPSA